MKTKAEKETVRNVLKNKDSNGQDDPLWKKKSKLFCKMFQNKNPKLTINMLTIK